jgi:hypothetical protein
MITKQDARGADGELNGKGRNVFTTAPRDTLNKPGG